MAMFRLRAAVRLEPNWISRWRKKMWQQTTKIRTLQTCRVHEAAARTSCKSEAAARRVEKVAWLVDFKGRNATGCETFINVLRVCPIVWLHFCRVCLEDFTLSSMTQWQRVSGREGSHRIATPSSVICRRVICASNAATKQNSEYVIAASKGEVAKHGL